MLSAWCQSDEDWHSGKLSFIFNVRARSGRTLQPVFFPLALITKGRTLFIQTGRGLRGENDRQRERERESEGKERERVSEREGGGGRERVR